MQAQTRSEYWREFLTTINSRARAQHAEGPDVRVVIANPEQKPKYWESDFFCVGGADMPVRIWLVPECLLMTSLVDVETFMRGILRKLRETPGAALPTHVAAQMLGTLVLLGVDTSTNLTFVDRELWPEARDLLHTSMAAHERLGRQAQAAERKQGKAGGDGPRKRQCIVFDI